MNDMILPQGAHKTMSSREIAQLCGKRHDNVCRDAEKLNETYAGMGLLKIEEGYYTHPSTGNQQHREFLLTKEQCIDLITGYRADLRIKINRRWAELEAQISQPSYMIEDPIKRAEKWIEEARQQIMLQEKLELQAPKVAFVEKYVASVGNKTFREVAKILRIKENAFRDFLTANKIMHKVNGTWLAYSNHTDAKRFHVITGVGESGHAYTQTLFTPKGVEWIAGELAKLNLNGGEV